MDACMMKMLMILQCRSLVAVYALLKLGGYENVVHVFGGLREWASRGLPLEGSNTAAWKDKAGALPP